MIVRLQLFFKKRYKFKVENSKKVQKYLLGYLQHKKWQKLRKINEGFKISRNIIETSQIYNAMRGFYLNSKMVLIQKHLKSYLVKKQVKKVQQILARK